MQEKALGKDISLIKYRLHKAATPLHLSQSYHPTCLLPNFSSGRLFLSYTVQIINMILLVTINTTKTQCHLCGLWPKQYPYVLKRLQNTNTKRQLYPSLNISFQFLFMTGFAMQLVISKYMSNALLNQSPSKRAMNNNASRGSEICKVKSQVVDHEKSYVEVQGRYQLLNAQNNVDKSAVADKLWGK